MREGFMNEHSDMLWLQETHLKGVPLPANWRNFSSFVLQGNEDAPHAVNLYKDTDPYYAHPYYRVEFQHGAPIYCVGCEYTGDEEERKVLIQEQK